jgi:Na+/H+ antiporter NhaA
MNLTTLATFLVLLAGIYVLFGIGFCLVLFIKGLTRLDPNTQSTGLGFKLLIIPGTIIFWPVLWRKLKKP